MEIRSNSATKAIRNKRSILFNPDEFSSAVSPRFVTCFWIGCNNRLYSDFKTAGADDDRALRKKICDNVLGSTTCAWFAIQFKEFTTQYRSRHMVSEETLGNCFQTPGFTWNEQNCCEKYVFRPQVQKNGIWTRRKRQKCVALGEEQNCCNVCI